MPEYINRKDAIERSGYKFCPYCGAKMNGGNNNGKTEKAGADCKNA